MRMRIVLLVVGLLMIGALAAGCGGDDEGDSGSDQAQTETGGTGGGEAGSEGGDSGGAGGATDPQIQQAVNACKQQIEATPGIGTDVKADLTEICEKAASGDEQAVRDATREVCTTLIEQNVPEGPARDQALTACEQAAP